MSLQLIIKNHFLVFIVGLQMFADVGFEEMETKGLGWISGKVSKIDNLNGNINFLILVGTKLISQKIVKSLMI